MDYKYLRLKILEVFGTLGKFAKAQNRDMSYVSRKLNNGTVMDSNIIIEWVDLLQIQPEMIGFYFFTRNLDKMQNNVKEGAEVE